MHIYILFIYTLLSCFSGEPRLIEIWGPKVVLEEENFKDEFFDWFLGFQNWLSNLISLKVLMTLFTLVLVTFHCYNNTLDGVAYKQ